MQYEIIVELKKEVLDPQGKAILGTLQKMGFTDCQNIQTSKRFVIDIDSSTADEVVKKISQELLANTVSETFTIKKL